MKALTIGDFRRWLAGIPESKDDLEVVLRISDHEEGDTTVCGLHAIGIESGCTETDALMLDGYLDEDEEDEDSSSAMSREKPSWPHCRHCRRRLGTDHSDICAVVHDAILKGRLARGRTLVVTAECCDAYEEKT